MSVRLRVAQSPRAVPLLTLGWRLGLGPLLGRTLCLITASADGTQLVRAAVPYVFVAGSLYVPVVGDPAWTAAATRKPQVTVQAHPGPLATRARPAPPDEIAGIADRIGASPGVARLGAVPWWVLEPTGDPGPPPALPDLAWVWFAIAAAALARRRLVQR
jgi:MYXO-CTERM domain-containing protein